MVETERREPKLTVKFREKVLDERRLLESVHELWEENSMVISRAGQEGDPLGTRRHGGGTMR